MDQSEPISGEVRVIKIGRTDRTSRLAIVRDIAGMAVLLFALIVTALVIVDKHYEADDLKVQLNEFRSEERVIDRANQEKAECRRRYESITDQNGDEQLNLLSDYVLILTNTEDPDRLEKLRLKAAELEAFTASTRAAEQAKINYENQGNPLPCPIGPTVLSPETTTPTIGG